MREFYTKTVLLNMCMVYNEANNMVLVQDKRPKEPNGWAGITFPGGHIEHGESVLASVKREVKEETGLTISNVQQCGLINWLCDDDGSRWLVFLYKTQSYSGNLIDETEEGKVFWMLKDKLFNQKLAPDFETYLKLFYGAPEEAFGIFGKKNPGKLEIITEP